MGELQLHVVLNVLAAEVMFSDDYFQCYFPYNVQSSVEPSPFNVYGKIILLLKLDGSDYLRARLENCSFLPVTCRYRT